MRRTPGYNQHDDKQPVPEWSDEKRERVREVLIHNFNIWLGRWFEAYSQMRKEAMLAEASKAFNEWREDQEAPPQASLGVKSIDG